MKLSEQIKNCLDGSGCGNCEHHEADTKFTCRGLLEKAYERIKGYEELEEQGLLFKLPCNVGDIVYALWSIQTEQRYVVYPAEVKEIRFGIYGNRRTVKYRLEPISYRGRILDFYSDDFGNKLFLEESEAESALQKMNEMEGKEYGLCIDNSV